MRMLSDASPDVVAQSAIFCCRDCRAQFFGALADIWERYDGIKEVMSETWEEAVDAPETWDDLCRELVDNLSLHEQECLAQAVGQLWFRLKEANPDA